MAAPKFKKTKVSQQINLKEEFGFDFSGKNALKQAIGQAIIDKIVNRSKAGNGMSFGKSGIGRKVKLKSPYSKSYADSLEFKAAGKSKNKVNMSLTGDMLGLIDITKIKGNTIEIGWEDADENKKAFNHSVGDTVPRRPFFGVNKKELNDIKSEFKSDIKEAIKSKNNVSRKAFEDLILGLINKTKEKP